MMRVYKEQITVEPLLKDTPEIYCKDTFVVYIVSLGHLCGMDSLLCPKYAFLIEIYPWNEDTSLYKALHQATKVSTMEGLICIVFAGH